MGMSSTVVGKDGHPCRVQKYV